MCLSPYGGFPRIVLVIGMDVLIILWEGNFLQKVLP